MTRNKNREKKPILWLVILSALFYLTMFLLTIIARDIHNSRLPQVTTGRLTKQSFSYTLTSEDGISVEHTGKYTALPKELADSEQIFTIRTVTENDMTFYYAVRADITVDTTKQNPDYYAVLVKTGYGNEQYILTGYEGLEDGDEVFLVNNKK